MKGIIVVNAYIRTKSQISQAERIAEELRALGVQVDIIKNVNLAFIAEGKIVAKQYDFCIFLDKDKAAARLLEKSGITLFNRAEAIEVCDDKMLTHIALAGRGISMPDCVYAPLCYYSDAKISEELISETEKRLGFPLVAKMCYGSLGAGVYLVSCREELAKFEEEHKLCPHFYQKFIDCGKGEDIRVIVIGGKSVCAMRRTNINDFRSNVELGGRGEKVVADVGLTELCERVAEIINLDYCGIDVLTDREGKRFVCEVNSNAFFAEAERVCGVNIAKKYAEMVINKLHNV